MKQRQQYIELATGWSFSSKGTFTGKLDRRDLYNIRHEWIPSETGAFGQMETEAVVPQGWKAPFALHFYASDDYASEPNPQSPHDWWGIESYVGHRFKQVLIDGVVVWDQDVGDHIVCPSFCADITPHVKPGKPFKLALRVLDKIGTDQVLTDDHMRIGTIESNKTLDGPRDFSTNVWWGDVALREQDDARTPMPARRMPLEAKLRDSSADSFPLPPLDSPWSGPIVLPLDTDDLPKSGFPVTCGIPLPYGKVRDTKELGLRSAGGESVPAQFAVTGKWPDGSIRWVLADLIALRGQAPYTLTIGKASAKPEVAVKAATKDGGVTVDTGALTLEFGADDSLLIGRITGSDTAVKAVSGVMTLQGGEVLRAVRDSVKVTARGPVRAEVEIAGKMVGESRTTGRFVFRVSAYAGLPLLRMFFRVFNDTDETLPVKSIVLSIRSGLGKNAHVRWTDAAGMCEADAKGAFKLNQPGTEAWKVKGITREVRAGEKATGWFEFADDSQAVQVAVRDFWQQYPKSMGLRNGSIEVGLAASTTKANRFDQTPGEAKRHEVWLNFGASDAARAGCMARPPRLFSPEYFAATGAMGPCCTRTRGEFPDYDAFIQAGYNNQPPEEIGYGIRDYGDRRFGRTQGKTWCNNYYDHMHDCIGEYRMTGGRQWFDRVETTARHVMDVDQIHYSSDPSRIGGTPSYDAINHTQGGFWDNLLRHGAGFTQYYRLTGDSDALQAAVDLADFIVRNKRMTRPGGSKRDYAGVMLTCIHAYDQTGDKRYLRHCRKVLEAVLDQNPRSRAGTYVDIRRGTFVEIHGNFNYYGNVPWMLAQLAEPIYLYWRLSGDPDAARAIVTFAESIICEDMYDGPGDFNGYTHNPNSGKSWSYHLLLATLLLCAHDLTGDDYLAVCARGAWKIFMERVMEKPRTVIIWQSPALLYFMQKLEGLKV